MLLTVAIMLLSRTDRRNATLKNILIHLVSSMSGGWTLQAGSGKDVNICFTLKHISHATDCHSICIPFTVIKAEDSVVTM